jgi:hypothetical protein
MSRYKSKPTEVEAIRWYGSNTKQIRDFCGNTNYTMINTSPPWELPTRILTFHTFKSDIDVRVGDYIVKDTNGNIYPCSMEIFENTYEEIKSIDSD